MPFTYLHIFTIKYFSSLGVRLDVHLCCGVKHVVLSFIHDFISNPLRICIRCYNAETEFKLTFISLNMGLKGMGKLEPHRRCFSIDVVI